MNNRNSIICKLLIPGVSFLFSAHVMADQTPADELKAILTTQNEPKEESLLSQQLDLKTLGQSISEKGFDFQLKAGMLADTIDLSGLGAFNITEDTFVSMNMLENPVDKEWQFGVGLGDQGEYLGEVILQGNENELVLSAPKITEHTVKLPAGNPKEMYEGSSLAELVGEENIGLPDMDLKFYPEPLQETPVTLPVAQEELFVQTREALTKFDESLDVQKEDNESETVYTVNCDVQTFSDMLITAATECQDLVESLNTPELEETYGDKNITIDIDEFVEIVSAMNEVMDPVVPILFTVQDGNLSKISSTVAIHTGDDTDGYVEFSYQLKAADQPENGYEIQLNLVSPEMVTNGIKFSQDHTRTEETETYVSTLEVNEGDESITIPLTSVYNSATGDLNVSSTIAAGDESISLLLNAQFTEIVPGESFCMNIKEAGMEMYGMKFGIWSDVTVAAAPAALPVQSGAKCVFDLGQLDVIALASDVMTRVNEIGTYFVPTEEETEVY